MKKAIAVVLLWLSFIAASGQNYKYFTPDHELSSSLINQIYQDSYGMVWIATEDGLNRYDGSKFTVYHNVPGDSTSLQHNFVGQIFEDSNKRLLVGTYRGMQIYDRGADRFSPLIPVITTEGAVVGRPVAHIIERKNGDIILLSDYVYRLVETAGGKMEIQKLDYDNVDMGFISYGIEDYDGNLWLLNDNPAYKSLFRIDTDGHVHQIRYPASQFFEVLTLGPDGNLYVGCLRSGLYRYDAAADSLIYIPTPTGEPISIKYMMPDPIGGVLFIATDGQGLKIYNPRTEEIKDFFPGSRDFTLPGEKIHYILKDSFDNFWIGIFQKGVVMFPEHQGTFGYIGSRSATHNVIGDKCVTALCKDSSGILWVGTDNGGIYSLNPDLSLNRHYTAGIPSVIMGIMDLDDKVMVGSYLEGWGILDKVTGKYTPVNTDGNQSPASIYSFSADDKGNIWIASMGNGVLKYDPANGKETRCDGISSKINQWVGAIKYSQDANRLYLGTYDGLYAVDDCDTDSPRVSSVHPGTIVYCISEGLSGKIWCGTSTGLLSYDPESGETHNYTTADGLPSNTVYAIEGEGVNAMWVSTNSGLARFDPNKGKFSSFHADDGLQGNEFYKNVSYKDSRGLMYFGGMNGITFFSPDDIKNRGIKYTTRIVDFYLHGTPVSVGMKSGIRNIIDCPVYEADKIRLSHNDNSFSVEFSTLELYRPESVMFMYALDNDNWETLPYNVNRVNFSNINPGTHTLRVKAVDNDVHSDVLSITIDIAPVWYNSWWARLCYVLVAAAAAWFIWRQVKNRQATRKEIMERENADRMKEARLQFFTNISHEIRTPMTLVISPIEKLMSSDSDKTRQKEYKLIHRNAKRILRLVNELMDIRKIDKNRMHLVFSETMLVPLIDDLCETFGHAAADKHITLSFSHEGHDHTTAWVDPVNFDKIIMNLLSNAVKFTPEGGKIDISLTTGSNDNVDGPLHEYVEISVTDTGIGIPEEERRHIFDRFYQVDSDNLKGTGIGLHLVNSLIQLHHGTIEVTDNPDGNGVRFTIRLPLGNSHLKVSDIALTSEPVEQARHASPDLVIVEEDNDDDDATAKAASSERVLVVEDDEEIRRYICNELSARYKVEECSNGKEALEIVFNRAPSLIISDVMMPEMDGLTLTRRIKKNINLHHIPVILLTAKALEKDNLEGIESGADAYITKPFNIDILMATVANMLSTRRRLRNAYSGSQSQDNKVTIQATSNDEKLMERIMKVLNKNIANPDITVEMLAEEVGMSRVHLHRKLKELTNQSPRDFIRNTRLRQAAKLMGEKDLNVSEVAVLTGFKSANNFATSFKELFGMTPTEYINKMSDRGGEA